MSRSAAARSAVRCNQLFGGQRCARRCIAGSQLRLGRGTHTQVLQEPIAKAIDPAVNGQCLTTNPGVAHDGRSADIRRLFDDIERAEAVVLRDLTAQAVEVCTVLALHILNMAKPIVDQPKFVVAQGGQYPTAAVMPTNDDVLYAEHIHRELDCGETVQVGMNNHVGDVAMNEHLSGEQADNLVGRHTTIRAADP